MILVGTCLYAPLSENTNFLATSACFHRISPDADSFGQLPAVQNTTSNVFAI